MNKNIVRLLSVTIAILLIASVFSIAFVTPATSSVPIEEPKAIDANVKSAPLDTSEQIDPSVVTHHSYWSEGDVAIWTYYNDLTGGIGLTYYTLTYIGTSVEIWVQNSIKFPSGDPRNGPGNIPGPTKPTRAMCEYLAGQYETNILPKESQFFGAPVNHTGINANLQYLSPLIPDDPEYYHEPSGRAVILVCNIRDENYYDSTYPYYIVGVHIGDYEDFYYDRNMVTLDAVSWFHGLGPAGSDWGPHYYWPTNTFHDHPVISPYVYDSTVAHEFQHLLHHELCPGDATFMNEGCSMFAEMLCGYGLDPDYPNSYFATPDNSLTIWGDQGGINILADYGSGALWTIYLVDRFGASFLQYYFTSGGGGVTGIDNALKHFKIHETFATVYRDWKLANLIRQDFGCCKIYNYKSLNLSDPVFIPVMQYAIGGLPVPTTKGTDFGNTITILGYDTGISKIAQYGSDYIRFENWTRPGFMYFDGDDYVELPVGWTMTADGWCSGTGVNMQDTSIVGSAAVSAADPTLTIVTKYSTEPNWDFGFVQVSTNNGATWTSLSNAYTTSDYLTDVPAIQESMPGFTGPSPSYPGFDTMSFDLTAYAGTTVQIRFRYMTDEAATVDGWWIQSATVSGNALMLAPPQPPKAKFQVTVVQALVICKKTLYLPYDMMLTDPANKGMTLALANKPSFVVLIVTPTAPQGLNDYTFQVTKTPLFKFFCNR